MDTQKERLEESILDSVKNKLSPDLWNGWKMKASAKRFIVAKLLTWLKTLTSKEPKDIYLLGSMAGYQYSDIADIDINFVVEVTDERVKELSKLLPNGTNLPGTQHPINYYVSNTEKAEWKKSGPIYDILKDKWIRKPTKGNQQDTITNFKAVSEIARFFILGIDATISEYEMDVASFKAFKEYLKEAPAHEEKEVKTVLANKKFEILADIDGIYIAKHMIKALRKEAFESEKGLEISTDIKIKDSNTSINNLIYKYLEKLDYFDKISKILDEREKWEKEEI